MSNRILKFRCWVTAGVMKDMAELDMNHVIDLHNSNNGIILMQYIGIKDKNDREIYEGDILKRYFPRASEGFRECEIKFVVSFYVDGFKLSGEKTIKNYLNQVIIKTPKSMNYRDWAHTEIIGNIYETPNLLPQTNK